MPSFDALRNSAQVEEENQQLREEVETVRVELIFYNYIVKRNEKKEPNNTASNKTVLLLDCSFGLT